VRYRGSLGPSAPSPPWQDDEESDFRHDALAEYLGDAARSLAESLRRRADAVLHNPTYMVVSEELRAQISEAATRNRAWAARRLLDCMEELEFLAAARTEEADTAGLPEDEGGL
jgi:hypothetical protein